MKQEELISRLEDLMGMGSDNEALEMAIKEIKAKDAFCQICINENICYRAEPMRWIPVTERLPQKSEYGDVLVTFIPSGGTLWTKVMIAHYSDLMGIAKPCFHVGDAGKVDFQDITNQVTAWMPLPKPWSGKESE